LMEGAILQGIDLEKQFLVGDLWKSVLDDDDALELPFPRGLLEAVVRRLCVADERPSLADEIKCKSLIFLGIAVFGIAVLGSSFI
jgi:sister chromatid cohesion protein DCC1